MPSILLERSNQAVNINAPTGSDLHITSHGSDWLWAAFCIFGAAALTHCGIFLFKGRKSISSVAAMSASAIMAFTYFTLAADLGWAPVKTEFKHVTVDAATVDQGEYLRQVFYARYIGWFLSWPCLLFIIDFVGNGSSMAALKATQLATYALEVGATEVYVLGLLIGILISSTYKWAYFTFSTAALLFICTFINYNAFKNYSLSSLSKVSLVLLDLVWILYPISWGLSEGGNVIQPDSEQVFYGVLDLLLFVVVPIAFVLQSSNDIESVATPASTNHVAEAKETEPEAPRASGETAV